MKKIGVRYNFFGGEILASIQGAKIDGERKKEVGEGLIGKDSCGRERGYGSSFNGS